MLPVRPAVPTHDPLKGKLSFKRDVRASRGFMPATHPSVAIKIDARRVGTIQPPSLATKWFWKIQFMVHADTPSLFGWITLAKDFASENEAKDHLIAHDLRFRRHWNLFQNDF